MGFTWIYIMLAAEHPKIRNHRGENISRAFFFQRQQSSASTPRSRMVPRWLYSSAGENNRKQLLHSKTMLAKYFTGRIHICFLTSQKGVGFIEESELVPAMSTLKHQMFQLRSLAGPGSMIGSIWTHRRVSLWTLRMQKYCNGPGSRPWLCGCWICRGYKVRGHLSKRAPGGCYIVASCKKRSLQTSAPAMPSQQYGLLTSPKKITNGCPLFGPPHGDQTGPSGRPSVHTFLWPALYQS